MTISSETNSVSYTGDGTLATYTVGLDLTDDDEFVLYEQTAAGVPSTLVKDTDYTVSYVGGVLKATRSDGVLPSGYIWTFERDPAYTQESDYRGNPAYNPERYELDYDKSVERDQALLAKVDRALKVPPAYASFDTQVTPVAGGFLGVNGDGDGFTMMDGVSDTAVSVAMQPVVAAASLAAAREALGVWGEQYNVKNYGAEGDGTTDDREAIQDAIDAAIAAGGGTVFFPPGEYALTTSSSVGLSIDTASGIRLLGSGRYATKLKQKASNAGNLITIHNSASISIESLSVDGNRTNQVSSGHCIRGEDVDGLTISDVDVGHAYSYGIGLQDGYFKNVRISRVDIHDTGADGIDCKNKDSGTDSEGNQGLFISDVTVRNWGIRSDLTVQAAIDLRGAWAVKNIYVAEPARNDCQGVRFRFGEEGDGANGLGGHYSSLSNFYINMGTATSGIGVNVGAPDVSVSNGYITGGQDGVSMAAGSTTIPKGVKFTAITVENHTDDGFVISTSCDDAVLLGCKVRGGDTAFNVTANNVRLIACESDGADEGFIAQSGCNKLRLHDCTIKNSVTRTAQVVSGAADVVVTGGVFSGNPSSNAILDAGTGTIVDGVTGGILRVPLRPRVVAASAVAASVTGTVAETTLATVSIPAGAIGANGFLRVTAHWSYTNSANNKDLRLKFGGTTLASLTATTTANYREERIISNRNATNSQVCFQGTTGGWSTTTSAATTGAVDTTASQNLTLTAQLASAGETITLEAYTVEVVYQA